jgi:uncharacterized membrane protein
MGFLFIVLCIAVYFYHQKHGCYFYEKVNSHRDALDIVRERYARGEISSEEFNERKKVLEEGGKLK